MRVTIARSMGLVALAAVGIAAMRYPSQLASSVLYTVVVVAFVAAAVAALSLPRRRRAIWFGFSISGLSYLLLSRYSSYGPFLLTDALVDYVRERINGAEALDMLGQPSFVWQWLNIERNPSPTTHQIVHSLFALVVATAGALTALVLTRDTNSEPPDHP